ncbi:MAG: ArsI/CadI family heavy metal resistance metalloenzyme [Bacteroidota bacterium]
MKRLHVALNVTDLETSIRFYSTLFDTEPTTRKPDYAKWMLDNPRVNFAISTGSSSKGIEHLGIETDDPAELVAQRSRIAEAGLAYFDEGNTICCYHESDKLWVSDPESVAWEIFHTYGTAEVMHGQPSSCCEPDCC